MEHQMFFEAIKLNVLILVNDDVQRGIIKEEYKECCYKQIMFRFFYDLYTDNVPKESLYKYAMDMGYDDIGREYRRKAEKFDEHKKKIYDLYGVNDNKRDWYMKNNGQYMIAEFQKFQLEDIHNEMSVLFKLANLKASNTKNYTNNEFIEDCKSFDSLYKKIEVRFENYFIKCLQYYQLEIAYRFETLYKFFKVMNDNNFDIP